MMSEELKNKLLEYYGELQYTLEQSNDYFAKRKIQYKMEAIDILIFE